MGSERWKRVEQVYDSVLARSPEQRAAVLDECCSDDPELRRDVESLLAAREQAASFLSPDELLSHIVELGRESRPSILGSSLGHYRILAELGAGAMGEVYRACDTRLDRHVALKILPAHFTPDSARVARFRLEAKAASGLNHTNIVTIYEIGQAEGTWFIAEELVEGVTLRERLSSGKLPVQRGDRDRLSVRHGARGGASGWHRAPRYQAREHHGAARWRGQNCRFRVGAH